MRLVSAPIQFVPKHQAHLFHSCMTRWGWYHLQEWSHHPGFFSVKIKQKQGSFKSITSVAISVTPKPSHILHMGCLCDRGDGRYGQLLPVSFEEAKEGGGEPEPCLATLCRPRTSRELREKRGTADGRTEQCVCVESRGRNMLLSFYWHKVVTTMDGRARLAGVSGGRRPIHTHTYRATVKANHKAFKKTEPPPEVLRLPMNRQTW